MKRILSMLICGIILAGGLPANAAVGKEFPVKPIEIVCPYTPGSSVDIMDRGIADIAPENTDRCLQEDL